ncbi:MAG: hypothetical protein K0Q93_2996 [Nocardioidaceae bacterium]|jgi:hypothetical protein|nr:hypothetical protein [Nocardioidaceae bacterium]
MTLHQSWRGKSRRMRLPAGLARPLNARSHWAVVGLTLVLVFVAAPVTLLFLQAPM